MKELINLKEIQILLKNEHQQLQSQLNNLSEEVNNSTSWIN